MKKNDQMQRKRGAGDVGRGMHPLQLSGKLGMRSQTKEDVRKLNAQTLEKRSYN